MANPLPQLTSTSTTQNQYPGQLDRAPREKKPLWRLMCMASLHLTPTLIPGAALSHPKELRGKVSLFASVRDRKLAGFDCF